MDLAGNKKRNGNADTNGFIQFANMIIGITFVQWLSTLSHYLGAGEYIGWVLTFLFAIGYLYIIMFSQKLLNPNFSYRCGFWNALRIYAIGTTIVAIIIGLFICVSYYYSENVPSVFVPDVFIMIFCWIILAFGIIPSLNKEDGGIT